MALTRGSWAGLAGALLLLGAAGVARAQHVVDFTVERYQPSSMPEPYFHLQGTAVLPKRAWTVGVAGSWAYRPLVVRDRRQDKELSVPVEQRYGVDVLGAYGVTKALSVGVAVPVTVFQSGDRVAGIMVNDERALAAAALGDPRVELKALVGKAEGFRPRGAFGLTVTLPLGDSTEFAGEAGVVIEPRVLVDFVRPRWALALNVGARLRTEEAQFFDEPIRNELWAGLGARQAVSMLGGGALARRIWLTGELVGVIASEGGPTPIELRGGVRVAWAHRLDVGLGLGIGMTSDIGSPALRAMLDVRWGGAPRDSDRDGTGDVCDPCVFEAEDLDGYMDGDGCPDRDNDGDELPDVEDQCPSQAEDMDGNKDMDGCPDPDDDGDGIDDKVDSCPNQAEDVDGWRDEDGCPDNDNDGDGISDPLDGCPTVAEPKDGVEDADGCPP